MQAPDDAMNGARKAAKRRSLLAMRRLHDIVALHRRGRALHAQPVVAVVATEDAPRLPQGIDAQRDDGETFLAIMAMPVGAPKECHGTYTVSNGYRLVAGDTCEPSKGIDRLPTVKRCPGLFSGAAAEVSSSGWGVLFVLLLLVCLCVHHMQC